MGSPAHVLIAHADPAAREHMQSLVEQRARRSVAIGADSFDALQATLATHPDIDLVIVDLDLPGMSGEVGLRYLSARNPGVRVAALFGNPGRLHRESSREVGPGPGPTLEETPLDALEMILASSGQPDDASPESVLSGHPTKAQLAFLEQELTTRQRDVLRLLSQGYSNRKIARDLGIAEGTVKVHVNAAFRGLGVHNRVSAAVAFREYFETREAQDGWTAPNS